MVATRILFRTWRKASSNSAQVALRDETIMDVNKRTHNNKLLIMIEG